MSEYIIAFDPTLCIACYGCNTACKSWREVPLGLDWCRVEKKWKGRDRAARPLYYAIYCKQCVNAPCIAECPEKALSKNPANGVVVLDEKKCTACKKCLGACPYDVPQFPAKGVMQKCDVCVGVVDLEKDEPPCVATCPPKALTFNKAGAVADKEKQEAALTAFFKMPYYEE